MSPLPRLDEACFIFCIAEQTTFCSCLMLVPPRATCVILLCIMLLFMYLLFLFISIFLYNFYLLFYQFVGMYSALFNIYLLVVYIYYIKYHNICIAYPIVIVGTIYHGIVGSMVLLLSFFYMF